ncbi:hypothetical protein MGH68_08360 [Erysipelothrix sp. D19-032]
MSALTNEVGLSFSWIELEDQDVDFVKDMVERVRNSVDIVVAVNKKESSLVFVVGASENAIKAGFKVGDLAKLAPPQLAETVAVVQTSHKPVVKI